MIVGRFDHIRTQSRQIRLNLRFDRRTVQPLLPTFHVKDMGIFAEQFADILILNLFHQSIATIRLIVPPFDTGNFQFVQYFGRIGCITGHSVCFCRYQIHFRDTECFRLIDIRTLSVIKIRISGPFLTISEHKIAHRLSVDRIISKVSIITNVIILIIQP